MITNGTLLTPELVNALCEEGVSPFISIDGPPSIHNHNRPYANGEASFEDAKRGLELFRAVGVDPGVSVTVTEEMLDRLPEYLEWLITKLGVTAIGFNMLEAIPGRTYFSDNYGDRFAEVLIKCQKICSKYEVYEERIMRKVKQFAKQELYAIDCAACGEQFTVAPDGQIGVCQGFVGTREFFTSNVNDLNYDPRVDPVFVAWSKVSPLSRDSCLDCPALGICGGGCPRNPYINGNGIDGIDTRFCKHVLKTHEWIIFDLYDKLNVS